MGDKMTTNSVILREFVPSEDFRVTRFNRSIALPYAIKKVQENIVNVLRKNEIAGNYRFTKIHEGATAHTFSVKTKKLGGQSEIGKVVFTFENIEGINVIKSVSFRTLSQERVEQYEETNRYHDWLNDVIVFKDYLSVAVLSFCHSIRDIAPIRLRRFSVETFD